jgi:drug/metabolite transporter (DMT)-like permease
MDSRNKMLFSVMVLLWDLNWSVMKMGLSDAPPFTFIFHRYFASFLFSLILLFLVKPKIPTDSNTIKKLLIYGLLTATTFTLNTIGLVSQTSSVAAVLTASSPIWVLILAVFFLDEHLSPAKIIGTIVGFLGIIILFLSNLGSILSFSSLILVLSAVFWSVASVYCKLKLQDVSPLVAGISYMLLTSLIGLISSIFFEPPFTSWSLGYLEMVAYSGILSTGIGMTIWVTLLGRVNTTTLSNSIIIVPMLALFIGWFLLGEKLGLETLAGSALVITSTYMVNRRVKPNNG